VNRARLQQLRALLPGFKADALLVSAIPNIRYLTGFTGSSALLLVTREEAVLFTDGRYKLQAGQEVEHAAVVLAKGPLVRALIGSVKRRRLRRLAFESGKVSFAFHAALRANLPGFRLAPLGGVVEMLRAIKSPEEVAAIRRAVELNSAVFEASLGEIRPGVTEVEAAIQIDHRMRLMGADKPAFDTIVAAGPRAALPHARPTRNRLGKNDLVIIDQGVILGGYSSDMTRTVGLGPLGEPKRRVYRAVLEAQLAAIANVRAGVKASHVDRQARLVLKQHGLDKAFDHSTGHGVGLEVHEPPRLGRNEKTKLEAGMVITIEPGAYLEDLGGVRIEDMVLVTDRGCEVLTPTPKDLRVL